jgi:hypothetical protein
MGRPRYQRGYVEEIGKPLRKWKVHWYVYLTDAAGIEVRHHRNRVVGRKPGQTVPLNAADAALPELTRAEVQTILDGLIREQLGVQVPPRRDGTMKFGVFWREQWLPLHEGTWRRNTRIVNKLMLEKHIAPRWDNEQLGRIDAPAVSAWLTELAKTYSSSMVHTAPTDFIFPSANGSPIHSENWRKRTLAPAAARAGVRCTYQIIRRTVTTLSIDGGVSVKAVQAQLRHAHSQTTMDVYAQIVTEGQRAAAERIFELVAKNKTT